MSTVELDEFLKPFSRSLGRTCPPEINESFSSDGAVQFLLAESMSRDDIVDHFIQEASKIGVNVHTSSAADVAQTIVKVIAELDEGTTSVLYADVAAADECGLADALKESSLSGIRWDASEDREAIQQAASCDAGVTFAFGAIAETGSVIQITSEGSGRSICTIPPCHVAVVHRSDVYERMGQALEAVKDQYGTKSMPSNITVISGPSATADIELVRVVGVHGPVKTAIVLVED